MKCLILVFVHTINTRFLVAILTHYSHMAALVCALATLHVVVAIQKIFTDHIILQCAAVFLFFGKVKKN